MLEIKNKKTGDKSLGLPGSFYCKRMGKEIKKTEEKIQYEACVYCHKKLDISVDMEIDYRPFYIEGAGQLCFDCYHKIYKPC